MTHSNLRADARRRRNLRGAVAELRMLLGELEEEVREGRADGFVARETAQMIKQIALHALALSGLEDEAVRLENRVRRARHQALEGHHPGR